MIERGCDVSLAAQSESLGVVSWYDYVISLIVRRIHERELLGGRVHAGVSGTRAGHEIISQEYDTPEFHAYSSETSMKFTKFTKSEELRAGLPDLS